MPAIEVHNEVIVLIHGLMRTKRSMYRLGYYLSRQGYEVQTYHYPSMKNTITEHATQLQHFIENVLSTNPEKKLHVVAHSLGGIIAREALSNLAPSYLSQCHCLIMLAPPNQGSPIAKLCLQIAPILSRFIRPLAELSNDPDAYVHQVAIPSQVKIGIIAGRFDAKVPPSMAYLKRQDDFVIINSSHTFIMNHPQARAEIIHFLQTGSFVNN